MSKIAFYDSGVGGLSVLTQAVLRFPKEQFIMLGDSRFAPFGSKSLEELRKIVFNSLFELKKQDIKAIVIACNTVSSHLLAEIREKIDLPIFGILPAVDEALTLAGDKKALVLATQNTISGKYMLSKQAEHFGRLIALAGGDIVRFVERGELSGERLRSHILSLLSGIDVQEIGAVALGCTHYPFIKPLLSELFCKNTAFVDGSKKTLDELSSALGLFDCLSAPITNAQSILNAPSTPSLQNTALSTVSLQSIAPSAVNAKIKAPNAETESAQAFKRVELLSSGDNIEIMQKLLKNALMQKTA